MLIPNMAMAPSAKDTRLEAFMLSKISHARAASHQGRARAWLLSGGDVGQEFLRSHCDFPDGGIEGDLIGFGRSPEAADFADELECRGGHFTRLQRRLW